MMWGMRSEPAMGSPMPHACRLIVLSVVASLFGAVASAEPELHWAFRPPTAQEPPAIDSLKYSAAVRNPIDQFVLQRLESADLQPAPPAEGAALVRRAYFDLLGLPPTPEQVQAFVNDDSPQAWANLIETLLASPHYGERWARHWLDVARYADSGGYETDIYYRNAWRYRDYVVKSFNDDKPFDVFVQEQIAGDELWPDNLDLDPRRVCIASDDKRRHREARIGTGFYTLGPRVHESGLDANRLAYETLIDWADTTASAFMGLTFGCARCHDHKFDPLTQEDYFSLQAIFAGAREAELPLWTSMEEADWKQNYPKVVAVEEARRAYRLFAKTTDGKDLTPQQQTRKQELIAAIGQAVLNLPEKAAGQSPVDYAGLMHIPTASVLEREHPELIRPVHRLERGELHKPLERRQPALPVALAEITGTPAELPRPFGSRKAFALWLTQPDHPLAARVIVNRIWQWHFGRGIVTTANDFGNMGQPPSHPELLDWLATGFVANNWQIKDLHRLIMNSATYRQSSQFGGETQLAEDPDNRLLWRMNRRRLEAEALWDAVHASAGTPTATARGTTTRKAKTIDRPIAGLIADLEQRGLLESTLLVWVGEFGRTPVRQGANGRDHHPYGFCAWMAGGGIVGGKTIGATDALGFKAIDDKVHVNDLHATMLGLLGIDHEELTYFFEGRYRRLTDVGGDNNLASRLVRG